MLVIIKCKEHKSEKRIAFLNSLLRLLWFCVLSLLGYETDNHSFIRVIDNPGI